MAKYTATGSRAITTAANGTILEWIANATRPRRLKFYEIDISYRASADAMIQLQGQRITASGTGTALTPRKLNPADAATESTVEHNHTADPTYTASEDILNLDHHQRNGRVWRAAPGREIVTPATASNGLGFRTPVISTGTPTCDLDVYVEEM